MDLITQAKEITLQYKGLEGILLKIAEHGKLSLWQLPNGSFSCRCEMRVNSVGVTFEIKSDFNHKTPTEAAMLCLFRITETLAKYGVAV